MRKHFIYALLILLCLAGCETVHGIGKDLENTGDNIHEAAEKLEQQAQETN